MASKRNKNRSANQSTSHQCTPQQLSTRSFEELQMRHLQVMLSHLANKAYLSLGKPNDELQKDALAPIRMYAQYLNLYMKFKDKCFPGEELQELPPSPNPTQQTQKENTNTQQKTQPIPLQHNEPHLSENRAPNRLQQTNHSTALLMNTLNSPQTKPKGNNANESSGGITQHSPIV